MDFLERFVEEALGGVVDDLFANLARDALHDDLGVENSAANAFAHQFDGLVNVGGEAFDATEPTDVVATGFEAESVGQNGDVLDALLPWPERQFQVMGIDSRWRNFELRMTVHLANLVVTSQHRKSPAQHLDLHGILVNARTLQLLHMGKELPWLRMKRLSPI